MGLKPAPLSSGNGAKSALRKDRKTRIPAEGHLSVHKHTEDVGVPEYIHRLVG